MGLLGAGVGSGCWNLTVWQAHHDASDIRSRTDVFNLIQVPVKTVAGDRPYDWEDVHEVACGFAESVHS